MTTYRAAQLFRVVTSGESVYRHKVTRPLAITPTYKAIAKDGLNLETTILWICPVANFGSRVSKTTFPLWASGELTSTLAMAKQTMLLRIVIPIRADRKKTPLFCHSQANGNARNGREGVI